MIITRTPLRMSFVGGGSDIASFYRKHGGAVLSTAIDKYVYVNINRKFDGGIRLAYSKVEEVDCLSVVEHRLIKSAFELLGLEGGVEITSTADIPSRGTGMGSSSSFTIGLLHALSAYMGRHVSAKDLAEQACHIEIERCGEPIGKQDQYAAAYGGLNLIEFNEDESVKVSPVILPRGVKDALQSRILLFYTGVTRSASAILKDQTKVSGTDKAKQQTLKRMVELAYVLRNSLGEGDLDSFGGILDENWRLKKSLVSAISTDDIDRWYDAAIGAGALGGKLLGAGFGGFLMFYAPEERHEAIKAAVGLRAVDVRFDPLGARVLFYHPN